MKHQMKPYHPYMTQASQLYIDGVGATGQGDTVLAEAYHKASGDLILAKCHLLLKQQHINTERLLAATQYYYGGLYEEALKVAKRIETRFLTEHQRGILHHFRKVVSERVHRDYRVKIRAELRQFWAKKDYSAVIRTLADHPYVLDRADMALVRGICCFHIRKWGSAARFYMSHMKFAGPNDVVVLLVSAMPITVFLHEGLAPALKLTHALIRDLPNSINHAIACSLLSMQEKISTSDRDQIRFHFSESRRLLPELTTGLREHPRAKELLDLAEEYIDWLGGSDGQEKPVFPIPQHVPDAENLEKTIHQILAV
jgi:hypothetical protein